MKEIDKTKLKIELRTRDLYPCPYCNEIVVEISYKHCPDCGQKIKKTT